ncbi:MAG: aldehyde ferredoxin oxidoreductase, partial [Thermoplasmata archaeon]|nr:aldehyde ferredoxin oxidoreductase [Thermoplasmata archaeon]
VTFHDASDMWGMECLATHDLLQEREGRCRTAVIGPAGEDLVRFAAITVDGHRHAGRGGAGAVMGSKDLKAIALTGSGKVPLHDPAGFAARARDVLRKIKENPFIPNRTRYGTPFWVKPINDYGLLPTRNFQEGVFEGVEGITAEAMQERVVDAGGACFNCAIACWNRSSVKTGPHAGTSLVGPEYENIALMGSNLGVATIEDVSFLNERCNELGMDAISLGNVLGFAVEAFQRGALPLGDIGYPIGWGDTDVLASLADDIAHRRTAAGDLLAGGVMAAAAALDEGSSSYAVHVRGMEVPGYDPRGVFGLGLAYATSDRGGCHQRAWTVTNEIGDPTYERFSFAKKAKLVKDIQDERAASFSLVLCDFAPVNEADSVALLNLATGFDHTVETYLRAGERIWNLARLFNIREGMDPTADGLPDRFFDDPFTEGQAKGVLPKREEFASCLQEYYALRGWDARGVPTPGKLRELGIEVK